ncbi:MAG: hypothetical protein LBE24_09750 [Methylobacillus sp.]|jgi:cytochrome oxidase Cu insertion factor (SCO1/SenC/PrrC family)|nr:hypothetical protein [Methylobacillus sp.]
MAGTTQQRKGRRMLLIMLVLFLLPLLVVLIMVGLDYRPGGESHGELVKPPRALLAPALTDWQGRDFSAEQWKDKWHLVVIANETCDADCQQRVYLVRQVHVMLNKEMSRAQRVLIVPDTADRAALETLQQKYPDLVILTGADAANLAQQFDLPDQPAATAGRVYIVDPLGNLMMSYPAGFDPRGLQKDMTRLLNYSWVG